MALLSAKNLRLPGINKLLLWFVGPYQVISTRLGINCLDYPPSMAAACPWFYSNLFKPARPKPTGTPALKDDSYKVEAILQSNKHRIHTQVKWIGYDSSNNQWVKLSELIM